MCSLSRICSLIERQRPCGDLQDEVACFLWKEAYYSVKRDLLQCQKRPATVSKETCRMRWPASCGKRLTTASKETCYSVKRDLQDEVACFLAPHA